MIAAVIALSAGAVVPPRVTVQDINRRYQELDGRIVEVRGWLGRCRGLSCMLYQDRQSLRSHAMRPNSLSIDFERAFDAAAVHLAGSEIVLRGRVNALCLRGDEICLDRAPDIEPLRIVRVLHHATLDHSE